ncbi:MAG: PAS domain S-box protein [Nitrospinaceae bacterium]|nr:MAG: PAS domain S-box protein [Nitrospinaceae bacterium]
MEEFDLFKSDKLSRAVESIAEAVIITDPGGTITYVNPAFEKVTGYRKEEALGRNPRILKSGQNPPEFYKAMWDDLLAGKVWQGKTINKRKDGSIYCAELTISPIWSETDRILSYVAVQRESTQEAALEEKARLMQEEYKVLHRVAQALHQGGDMKEMLNGALGHIVEFQELAVEVKAGIFLADEKEKRLRLLTTLGNFSDEFLAAEQDIPYGDCLCGKAAASGEMLVSNSCFTDERHNRRFPDMTAHGHYIVPLKSRGRLVGVMFLYTDENPPWYERSQEILLSIGGLIADAIEHRHAEEKTEKQNRTLAQANETLAALNAQKNEFLGIASHDLRNPLYVIRSYSEALLADGQGPINDQQKKLLIRILEAGNQMTALLDNLLDISKIESGRCDLHLETQDFNALVRKQMELHQLLAGEKNIRIRFEEGELAPFPYDKDSLTQVTGNLISNAIKFSPPGSTITLATEEAQGRARFSVRDEGPGISKEDREHLFGTFRKLSAKPTGGEKSTGLGLAIAKKIVHLHGGDIGVLSTPGTGSTFYFTLPLTQS